MHPCLSHPNSKHHTNLQRLCRRRSKTHITNQRFELAQVELKGVLVNGAHHIQRRKRLQSRTGLQLAWKSVRILDLQRIHRQTFHISLNPGSDPSCKFFTVAITRGWPTPALHGVALAKADSPANPFLGVWAEVLAACRSGLTSQLPGSATRVLASICRPVSAESGFSGHLLKYLTVFFHVDSFVVVKGSRRKHSQNREQQSREMGEIVQFSSSKCGCCFGEASWTHLSLLSALSLAHIWMRSAPFSESMSTTTPGGGRHAMARS